MRRNAVVTGASRGIGRCIARQLTGQGWRVFNLDRAPPECDGEDVWVEVDLSDPEALARVLGEVLAEGPVSALVNNAGIARRAPLEATGAADFDLTAAINVRAPMLCARAVLPDMGPQRSGRIVNIASRAHLGKRLRTAYAASKGALVSMTRVWALETAADGITCNAIAPGPVRTALFEQVNPPDDPRTRAIVESVPVGRLGEPDDIANAVLFFIDEKTGWVTGQVLYVCGGVTLARGGS